VARYAEFDRLLAPIEGKVVLIHRFPRGVHGNCGLDDEWCCSSDAKTWRRDSQAS